jgi:hypothetical protein
LFATRSLFATQSLYATQSISASYASTASRAKIADTSDLLGGTATAGRGTHYWINWTGASEDYDGSIIFDDGVNAFFINNGVYANINGTLYGNADTSTSSSHAITSSYALSVTSASYASTTSRAIIADTATNANSADTLSGITTAGKGTHYWINWTGAGEGDDGTITFNEDINSFFINNDVYANIHGALYGNADTATNATSASYAKTASIAYTATNASYATNAGHSSDSDFASAATDADTAISSSYVSSSMPLLGDSILLTYNGSKYRVHLTQVSGAITLVVDQTPVG